MDSSKSAMKMPAWRKQKTIMPYFSYNDPNRSVIDLADDYDLIVLDHPWVGTSVAREALLPLDPYLDTEFLQDQAANSVGPSYESYFYEGHCGHCR